MLAGNLLLFVFRFLPPPSPAFWVIPPVILALGGWLVWKAWGKFVPVALWVATLVVAYLGSEMVWPGASLFPGAGSGTASSVAGGGETLPARPVPGGRRIEVHVPDRYRQGPFDATRFLHAPPGFSVGVFASGLGQPRFMAFDNRGVLYASIPRSGKIVALPDADDDGIADRVVDFATDLDRPHGLAWDGEGLVVAETGRLLRIRDTDSDLAADVIQVLSKDLPTGGGHWTRTVVVGPDGFFYVSAGSSCDSCPEDDPRRAAVRRFPPDGGQGEPYAAGLRNSVGLAFHPVTGELWGSDNGRDFLGDELPPEEINLLIPGADYGWPFCYGDRVPDPKLGSLERCKDTVPPQVQMQAHSAPLGISFGSGLDFPQPYPDMLLVAFHGSWNRSEPTGYKLVGIPFSSGRPSGPPTDIVTGWLDGATAWGRPVAPIVGPDGALYLSDDRAGAIYRIYFEKNERDNK